MNDIIEIPVFIDHPDWEKWFSELKNSGEVHGYHAFKHLVWSAAPGLDVYFYLVNHLNEHLVKESLSAIIPCAPMTVFCSHFRPSDAKDEMTRLLTFYQNHFNTPYVWLMPASEMEENGIPEIPHLLAMETLDVKGVEKALLSALTLIRKEQQKEM